ncbi:MAG: GHKL domain-containing protein [Lachnospiraceae bacterium]
MDKIIHIAELVLWLLPAWFLRSYMTVFLVEKKGKIRISIGWGIFLLWQLFLLRYTPHNPLLTAGGTILSMEFVSFTGYGGPRWKRFFFPVLLCSIWIVLEMLVGYVFYAVAVPPQQLYMLGGLLSSWMLWSVIALLRALYRDAAIRDISLGGMFSFAGLSLTAAVGLGFAYIHQPPEAVGLTLVLSITAALIILYGNVMLYKLVIRLSEMLVLQYLNDKYLHQLEECTKQMQHRISADRKAEMTMHDIKQLIGTLKRFAQKHEDESMLEYLAGMSEIFCGDSSSPKVCENMIVDAILCEKIAVARSQNIAIKTDVRITKQLPIQSAQISILLGNALDNAIEAAGQMHTDRCIELCMRSRRDGLWVLLKNTFSGELQYDQAGNLRSSKAEQGHGLGMASMYEIVRKHQGILKIEAEEHEFLLYIMLFNQCDTELCLMDG